jgi:hypothetical protein
MASKWAGMPCTAIMMMLHGLCNRSGSDLWEDCCCCLKLLFCIPSGEVFLVTLLLLLVALSACHRS